MKTLYSFILEAATSSKDLSKHNYAYLRTFLKRIIQDPNNVKLGPYGEKDLKEVDHDASIQLARELLKKVTGKEIRSEEKILKELDNGDNFINANINNAFMNKLIDDINGDDDSKLGGITGWTGIYKQSVKDGQFDVSSEDLEYLLALSANMNSEFTGEYKKYNKYKKNPFKMMLVINGNDPETFNENTVEGKRVKAKLERLLNYYNNSAGKYYRDQIDNSAKRMIEEYGAIEAPMMKTPTTKNNLAEGTDGASSVPKTDLQTMDGKVKSSLKKLPDSQIASGSPLENKLAMDYALSQCKGHITKDEYEELEKLVKEIDDLKGDANNNTKLTELYKELLKKNPLFTEKFVYAHISGIHKFKGDSAAVATSMYAFDLSNPDNCETIDPEIMAKYYAKGLLEGKINIQSTTKGDLQNALRLPIQMKTLEKQLGSLNDFEKSITATDDYEDDKTEEFDDEMDNEKENPSKIWHKRKNKITGKTTKNYYNSKGDSISPAEYKERINNYKKHH